MNLAGNGSKKVPVVAAAASVGIVGSKSTLFPQPKESSIPQIQVLTAVEDLESNRPNNEQLKAPPGRQSSNPNTYHNISLVQYQHGNEQSGLMRSYKEEGIEMVTVPPQVESPRIPENYPVRSKRNSDSNEKPSQQLPQSSSSSQQSPFSHNSSKIPFANHLHDILSKCVCNTRVFWIYACFVVVFGAISLSICISAGAELASLKEADSHLFAKESLEFWQRKFIMNIITTKSSACPPNYEDAIEYTWSGTTNGCACPYVKAKKQEFYIIKGKCNSELIAQKCYDISPSNQLFLSYWRNAQRICVHRDPHYSFFNSPTSCGVRASSNLIEFRQCGSGQTAICRPVSDDCPVSYITNANDANTVGNDETKILEIDSSVKFSFEMKSEHYPVSSFRMDEYSHCDHSSKQQISKGKRGDYILLNKLRTFCTQNDTRPVQLDTIGEETLFKQNQDLWNLLMVSKKFPAYPRPSNSYTWVLSSMPYPAWTMSCRDSADYSMGVVEDRFTLSKESYNQVHLIVTTSISLFVVSLVLVIIEVRRKFIRNTDVKYYKGERFFDPRFMNNRFGRVLYPRERGWVRTTYLITAVHWVFRILNIPSIFISFLRVDDSITWFAETVTKACSDAFYVNNIANDYQARLNQLRDFYAVMLGFWWALFVIDILYFVFRYYYEILPAQEEEFLTDFIVKGGDKQEVVPIMHRSKAQNGQQQQHQQQQGHLVGHTLQQSAIIEEEGFDEDQLYEDEKKR